MDIQVEMQGRQRRSCGPEQRQSGGVHLRALKQAAWVDKASQQVSLGENEGLGMWAGPEADTVIPGLWKAPPGGHEVHAREEAGECFWVLGTAGGTQEEEGPARGLEERGLS